MCLLIATFWSLFKFPVVVGFTSCREISVLLFTVEPLLSHSEDTLPNPYGFLFLVSDIWSPPALFDAKSVVCWFNVLVLEADAAWLVCTFVAQLFWQASLDFSVNCCSIDKTLVRAPVMLSCFCCMLACWCCIITFCCCMHVCCCVNTR